jgi:hypothetical protein
MRRGDYFENKNLGITSEQYCSKAMRFFVKKGVTSFTLFTDDLIWGRNFAEQNSNRNFEVNLSYKENAILALTEMSKFKNSIISNSTFSFWGHFFSGSLATFPYPFYNQVPNFAKNLFTNTNVSKMIIDRERVPSSIIWKIKRIAAGS